MGNTGGELSHGRGHSPQEASSTTTAENSTNVDTNNERFRQAFLKRLEENVTTTSLEMGSHSETNVAQLTPLQTSDQPSVSVKPSVTVFSDMTQHSNRETEVGEVNQLNLNSKMEDAEIQRKAPELDSVEQSHSHALSLSEIEHYKEEKEHMIMEGLFSCSLTLSQNSLGTIVINNPALYRTGVSIYLESFMNELQSETSEMSSKRYRLKFSHVEEILLHGVRVFLKSGCLTSLRWLADCYIRCTQTFLNSNMILARSWRFLMSHNGPTLDFDNMGQLILRYAVLNLQCPDYFTMTEGIELHIDLPAPASVVFSFIEKSSTAQFQPFFIKVLDEIADTAEEDLERILVQLIGMLSDALKSRQLSEPLKPLVSALQFLLTCKRIPSIIRSHPTFLPTPQPHPPNGRLANGWEIQNNSLLGHLLRPSPLDELMCLKDGSQSTRQRLFRYIFNRPASALSQSITNLRQEILEVIETSSSVITTLCKGDILHRHQTLRWISSVMDSNEIRHQQAMQGQLDMLSGVPIAEAFALRFSGLSCDGFNLNVFWVLLKLLEPVKIQKVGDLNPFYILRDDMDSKSLLGHYTEEGRFGDSDELKKILELYNTKPDSSASPKFPTQLLWLAFRGLRCLFYPAIKSYEALLRKVEEIQAEAINAGPGSEKHNKYELLIGQLLCFQSFVHHPKFLVAWWNFVNLSLTFFGRINLVFNKCGDLKDDIDNLIINKGYRLNSLLNQCTLEEPSPQLLVLPLAALEDLMECVTFYCSLPAENDVSRRDFITATMAESTAAMDGEFISTIALFIMRSGSLIRNPHCRWSSGSQPLFSIYMHPRFHSRLNASDGLSTWLIPAVVISFIDAQKAGYYGRIQQRLIYTRLLERALSTSHHSQRLKEYAVSDKHQELFTRFLAMLVDSMTWLLEEAMSSLAEIKKRESTEVSTGQNSSTRHQEQNRLRLGEYEDEEQDTFDPRTTEEGHNVSEMPFEQLEKLCQSLMDGGLRAVKVMGFVAKICGQIIVSSPLLLTQVVTSLDCCLEHLVGPRCLQLKVSSFEKYNFDPRQLLAATCEIYNHLERADGTSARLLGAICADTRYFKPAVFIKGYKIARREGLLNSKDLIDFSELTKLLQEKATEVEKEEQWLTEIWDCVPDEYKDPIMDELMSDPVQLPTSGQIMDRKHIERHLTTEEFDPFNRMPLKKEDLIAQPELQHEIQRFVDVKKREREK